MAEFQRATPESLGIPSENLIRFYRELSINTLPLHHFILMRHGKIATEGSWRPYKKDMDLAWMLARLGQSVWTPASRDRQFRPPLAPDVHSV